tara:strand:+ start:893 stop:1300 length:408 start_codon:yes stop_codon:yes gene_type:complete
VHSWVPEASASSKELFSIVTVLRRTEGRTFLKASKGEIPAGVSAGEGPHGGSGASAPGGIIISPARPYGEGRSRFAAAGGAPAPGIVYGLEPQSGEIKTGGGSCSGGTRYGLGGKPGVIKTGESGEAGGGVGVGV